MNSLPDVYFVSSHRAIEFSRNPRAGEPFENCQAIREPTCVPKLCQLTKISTGEERWMTSCASCPAVYPWLGNPLGEAKAKPVLPVEQIEPTEEVIESNNID